MDKKYKEAVHGQESRVGGDGITLSAVNQSSTSQS